MFVVVVKANSLVDPLDRGKSLRAPKNLTSVSARVLFAQARFALGRLLQQKRGEGQENTETC